MKKIISLFQRNYDGDRLVRNEVVPGAEWVLAGEGVATRKFDGTCCLVAGGRLLKRYEVKPGATPPVGFEPANEVDENTGKQQGWLPLGSGPESRWHWEAWDNQLVGGIDKVEWTFELCGPKVQGNPEHEYVEREVGPGKHLLIPHGKYILGDAPRDFEGIKAWLAVNDVEGIVWHHPDGRMVKIKGRDFGLKRPTK
jgi:hypothetical protein